MVAAAAVVAATVSGSVISVESVMSCAELSKMDESAGESERCRSSVESRSDSRSRSGSRSDSWSWARGCDVCDVEIKERVSCTERTS